MLIYSLLSVAVLFIVGSLLITSLTAQGTVRKSSQASTSGQLVSKSVAQGIRNASSMQLIVPAAGIQLLKARTVGASANPVWRCQAWYFGNGEVRYTTSGATIPTPAPADVATWTLLATGIQPSSGTNIFTLTGRQLDLAMQVRDDGGNSVLIKTSALSRQPVPVAVESVPTCL
ncbi:hypothetical protein [Cryobacterium sp. TMT2-42-4]|uniref:hypothetical protein n=1 Tax=Cryobacterium sp. TMT2-42-4 TaxID=1259255 RepID=UPI001069FCBF|nr:hypothetical protein [Cryobacterium sp. TMT2-42-4]TFC35448.1 hypothetical protein E3O18_10030 [Cryobacterium sp. TMT2-42-4]